MRRSILGMRPHRVGGFPIVAGGAAAVAAAVVANVLIRIAATEAFGVDAGYEHLAWRAFITTTVVVVVLAALFSSALHRSSARPGLIFTRVAALVFALSLAGPVSLLSSDPKADAGIAVTLGLMHVATALAVWRFLRPAGVGAEATT